VDKVLIFALRTIGFLSFQLFLLAMTFEMPLYKDKGFVKKNGST